MQNQIQNSLLSIGAAITGTVAPFIEDASQFHVPPIVMECFQLLSWGAAIVIAFVTFMKWFKNAKNK